jgi:alpha-tubulin suppressor-like RCC1 family protein
LTQVTRGGYHICGLADDGKAYCWGLNSTGQLGDGTTVDQPAPVAVVGGGVTRA